MIVMTRAAVKSSWVSPERRKGRKGSSSYRPLALLRSGSMGGRSLRRPLRPGGEWVLSGPFKSERSTFVSLFKGF